MFSYHGSEESSESFFLLLGVLLTLELLLLNVYESFMAAKYRFLPPCKEIKIKLLPLSSP